MPRAQKIYSTKQGRLQLNKLHIEKTPRVQVTGRAGTSMIGKSADNQGGDLVAKKQGPCSGKFLAGAQD